MMMQDRKGVITMRGGTDEDMDYASHQANQVKDAEGEQEALSGEEAATLGDQDELDTQDDEDLDDSDTDTDDDEDEDEDEDDDDQEDDLAV